MAQKADYILDSNSEQFLPYDSYLKILIQNKLKKGHAPGIVISGETNSGKSMLGLLLAYGFQKYLHTLHGDKADAEFDPLTNKFYSIEDFADALEEGKIKHGVVILEEVQTNLDYRSWNSHLNRAMSKIFSTQRFRNNLYILILPHIKLIEKTHLYFINATITKLSWKSARVYGLIIDYGDPSGKFVKRKFLEQIYPIPLPPEHMIAKDKEADIKNKEKILIEDNQQRRDRKLEKEMRKEMIPMRYQLMQNKIERQKLQKNISEIKRWE